jgi:hypothetical protein
MLARFWIITRFLIHNGQITIEASEYFPRGKHCQWTVSPGSLLEIVRAGFRNVSSDSATRVENGFSCRGASKRFMADQPLRLFPNYVCVLNKATDPGQSCGCSTSTFPRGNSMHHRTHPQLGFQIKKLTELEG